METAEETRAMLAYTLQIGPDAGEKTSKPPHSQVLNADSLAEAIDKAKAVTRLRPAHANETDVRLIEGDADGLCLWSSSVEAIRA